LVEHRRHAEQQQTKGHLRHTEGGVVVSTLHDSSRGTPGGVRAWSRTRWLIVGVILVAIVIAVVSLLTMTGGGSGMSGHGGGWG
jgi:hypothetical protein